MTGPAFLTGKARVAGVMGWPVGHSRSPRIHGYWLRLHGIDGIYIPLPVAPDRLGQALRALPVLGFAGCNLTIPHKVAALALVDRVSEVARRIGAINLVVVQPDGSLLGDNTDGFGFVANLRQEAPGWRPAAGPAVLLGAGGAAMAVATALLDAGVPALRLVNRTQARAEQLAAQLGARATVVAWAERADALAGAALLVNTSSLGMTGQPPLELPLAALPEDAVVSDIVYAPLETDLLRQAKARGHPVVGGIGMLLHQARPAFQAWFGALPEVTAALVAVALAD